MCLVSTLLQYPPGSLPYLHKHSWSSCPLLSAAAGDRVAEEYMVDIEISFENVSFLESIRAHLNNLSFPIRGTEADILNIAMTTGECYAHCLRVRIRRKAGDLLVNQTKCARQA
jgi:hypothetical protein